MHTMNWTELFTESKGDEKKGLLGAVQHMFSDEISNTFYVLQVSILSRIIVL